MTKSQKIEIKAIRALQTKLKKLLNLWIKLECKIMQLELDNRILKDDHGLK